MTHNMTDGDIATDELDRAHQEFLAKIVHLDGKAAQRLFERIVEASDDATAALNGDRQHGGSAQ